MAVKLNIATDVVIFFKSVFILLQNVKTVKYLIMSTVAMIMLCSKMSFSQEKKGVTFGVELDALPYVTGGSFGAFWLGKNQWRVRALGANVHKPDWATKKGFNHHDIAAFAVVVDLFQTQNWRKWWIGAGPVFWNSKIRADGSTTISSFSNFLLNGSIGYNLSLGQNIYLSPWAGMSLKIAGDKDIVVQNKIYNLPILNPEMSLKLGFHF